MHEFLRRRIAVSTSAPAIVVGLICCGLICCGLTGCGKDTSEVLGQAYVAPATLNLRRELNQKNATVAVLKHGERVSILDVRRRFVKVQTQKGDEGWVDSVQLLSPEQMDAIHREAERALALPSEGSAGVYEALNIHIDPSRQSPALARIPEGGSVAVLGHRLEPKIAGPLKVPKLVSEPTEPKARKQKGKQAKSSDRLPPRPAAPKAPANWQQLFRGDVDAEAEEAEEKKQEASKAIDLKKPVVMEDWSLVRTKDNQSGWVLSRNLVMSIPDEVAQYAEGKRITSYFDLGSVQDEEKGVKHNWLWTTAPSGVPYDYDAWRVFLWNKRRHRYETSYRQHDVEGYFPVHVDAPDANAFGRTFELITKDDDGKFRRRTFMFDGSRVHLTDTENYQPGQAERRNSAEGIDTNKLEAKAPHDGWFHRQWTALRKRFGGK